MSCPVQCVRLPASPPAHRRTITLHNKPEPPAARTPVPHLTYPRTPALFHPSPILGDPYTHMQSHLLSLYLTSETAHRDAILQHNAWVADMGPLIFPGQRRDQDVLSLQRLERKIRVTMAQMQDRASRLRYVWQAREWRNIKTEEYIAEQEGQRGRRWGRRRGRGSLPAQGTGSGYAQETEDWHIDHDEVQVEWEHLLQGWKPNMRDVTRSIAEANDLFTTMHLDHACARSQKS